MKRISTILVALLCTVSTIFADLPFRNHRYDAFKVLPVTSDNIVFIGNSITDMHCWPEAFVTSTGKYLPIVNRGNSGTYSTEQSDNLESYINGKPKKVFMMIGTNDIATSGGLNFSPEQVLSYVKSIVTRIHARSPQTKVYLYSILNNNTSNRVEATWLKTNEIVKAYADATDKVTYIDLYDKLINVANGGVWSYDNLHLTAASYQVWCETICEYLAEDEDYTVSCVYPINTAEIQNDGGLGRNSHGMRATYFSCLPIKSNDVLVFGDSFVKNGEWQELLGNRNVKNRGTGWGNSGDIATTSKLVDATFATVAGVTKENAKAIFLYTGTGDACGDTDIATVKSNYKALVDKIAEKYPTSKIYLMAVCPRNNASHNERIAELNTYMESLVSDKIRYIDTYTPFINEGTINSKYVFSNSYISGLAYIKMANLMKTALLADFPTDTYNVTSEPDAEVRYNQAGLRNQLTQVIARGLVATRGDAVGQYNATAMAAFDTKVAEANTLLERNDITQDEVTTFANALNEILNGALTMPEASTANEEFWYQLNTPNRLNKYLSSTGAGAGVVGVDKNNYATSMWKFVLREDGTTLDIINRHDGSYLAPTAAHNTQLSTSETQPEAGWTLSYCDAPGLFIVSSGTVQLNQTDKSGTPVYNWGGGTDRGDTGCQYMVTLVEGEPDEIPDPSLMTMTLTPTQFANGTSTYTYHGSTTSGGWYGKLVTGTTPALTIESTDEAANNIGWSSSRPWLKAGYTYNLTLAEEYYIVGYELTTLSTSVNYSNTYTYTTAEGAGTSEAQNSSTEKTVTAENLSTGTVALAINGDATSSNYGILITKLVIKYKEIDDGIYPIEIKESTGAFATTGSYAKLWNYTPTSGNPVALTLSCGANNMNVNDGYLQLHSGQAESSTYTIAVPRPYIITGYSFGYAFGNSGTGDKTITVGEQQYAVAAEKNTLSVSDLTTQSTQFTLAGSNEPVKLTDFVVNVINPEILGEEEPVPAGPESGKYYRVAYDYGGSVGVKYLQSTASSVKGLAMTEDMGEGSIFLVETVAGNLRLKSISTGKYIKEDGTARGLHDTGGNVTFTLNEDGTVKIQAPSYFHANSSNGNYFLDHCGSDGSHTAHNFIVTETKGYTLTVDGPAAANATATWNGETKKLPATWSLFEGMTVTDATLTINCASHTLTNFKEGETTISGNTIEIDALTANRTFTTTFAPDIFSATYGEKWMHITRASNANHAITLGNTAAGTIPTFNNINYADEGTLWCFVGTAESFKIYNRTSGNALALTPSETPANGVTIELADAAQATNWHLISYNDGYAIAPVGNTSHGINSFGGSDYLGGPVKFWGVSDGGTHWRFNMIDTTKPLTLSIEVNGDQPYHVNYRVAELTTTIAEQTSMSIVQGNIEAMTYYLPVGATISLENTFTYRGYTFDGFKDAEGNAAEYNEATIPAGGLELTVSYSVDENNKYQYLFYSNDPVMNKPYRIPAIAVTRKGTILAVTDHRPGGSDVGFAPVDIKIRRSDDNGVTWTDEEFVADGTGQHVTVDGTTYTNVFDYAFGDAAIVADRESDEVLIMCVGGKQNFPGATATSHNYTARLRSHDGGVTWDEPENVTANFMDVTPLYNNENPKGYEPILPDAYSLFYGSGRIFQSRVFKAEGSNYYRIYAALLVREVREGETGASHNNYVVYSDNFGETWNLLGGRCVNGGDEAKVEELPDGTIIISSRKAGGRYFNIFTFTDIAKAEGSWGTTAASTQVYDGGGSGTDGEIYKVKAVRKSDGQICDVMLQSVPLGPGRSNVMIHYKEMEYNEDGTNKYAPAEFATGWNRGLQVSDRASAYSTMALQTDGNFGFFYEEVPNGYCMVYIPLSLEEITNGTYSLYTVNSTINEYEIGTFYASEAMQIPEGIKAYVATELPKMEGADAQGNATGVITMTELEGVIPAHTGAVLRGKADTYKFIPSISYGNVVEDNMLVGYEAADNKTDSQSLVTLPDVNAYTTYVLTVENNQAGFYKKTANFNVYNNKAYLKVPATVSANALSIRFDGDGTTGVESTVNGQQSTVIYDLQGRRVLNPTKGVYIVNGKKIVKN